MAGARGRQDNPLCREAICFYIGGGGLVEGLEESWQPSTYPPIVILYIYCLNVCYSREGRKSGVGSGR